LGRSNVGKSSLLNSLVGVGGGINRSPVKKSVAQKSLARISSRPGCTQLVNFYQVDGRVRFVDLPGYGFAKVPQETSRQWKALIEQYLDGRASLRLCVIVLDARRGWMDKDVELRDWLESRQRPYLVVATKVDKLRSQKDRHQSQRALREGYSGEILECSAETGRGVREIWQAISKIKTGN
jgi:GTP-binding protein